METVEMIKVDEKKEKMDSKGSELTIETAIVLGRSIVNLLESCSSLNGKLYYSLGKNEVKLQKFALEYRKKQAELLNKYGLLDDNGFFKQKKEEDMPPSGNPFLFKSDDLEQEYEKEAVEYLNTTVSLDLHKVDKLLFESLEIPTAENKDFFVLVDNLSF